MNLRGLGTAALDAAHAYYADRYFPQGSIVGAVNNGAFRVVVYTDDGAGLVEHNVRAGQLGDDDVIAAIAVFLSQHAFLASQANAAGSAYTAASIALRNYIVDRGPLTWRAVATAFDHLVRSLNIAPKSSGMTNAMALVAAAALLGFGVYFYRKQVRRG